MAKVSLGGEFTFWIEELQITIDDLSILPCPTLVTPGAERRTEPLTVTVNDICTSDGAKISFGQLSDCNCGELRSLIEKRCNSEDLNEDEEAFVESIVEALNDINDRIGPTISCTIRALSTTMAISSAALASIHTFT